MGIPQCLKAMVLRREEAQSAFASDGSLGELVFKIGVPPELWHAQAALQSAIFQQKWHHLICRQAGKGKRNLDGQPTVWNLLLMVTAHSLKQQEGPCMGGIWHRISFQLAELQ